MVFFFYEKKLDATMLPHDFPLREKLDATRTIFPYGKN